MDAVRKAWLVLVLVGGAALFSPSLRTPYLLDDYMHAAMAEGRLGIARGPFGLYDFVNDADRSSLMARGLLPWWSDSRLQIRFFRPLSSALRWLELRALPDHVVLMHVHSLAWWALAVLLAARLYRRLVPARAVVVATTIFALGPWHVLPLGWLANREVLLTVAVGIVALDVQRRLQRTGSPGLALLATALFVLAFGCGEYAFCLGGYVLALACTGPARSFSRRAVELVPFALPAAGYLVVRAVFGYGTNGSSFYADPLHQPLNLLAVAPARLTMLLAESWLTLGTEPWGSAAPRWVIALAVVTAAGLVALALRRVRAELSADERDTLAWLLAGSLLALVPVLPAVPSARLLAVSALGLAPVVGLLLDRAWFPADAETRRAPDLVGLVATGLAFALLVHGPLASWYSGRALADSTQLSDASLARLAHDLRPGTEPTIVRGSGGAFFGPFSPWLRGHDDHVWRVLAQTPHVLAVVRNDHELELTASEQDPIYPSGAANLYRDAARPLRVGETIVRDGMRVQIVTMGPGGPTRVRFTFDRPLDDPRFLWLDERIAGLTKTALPKVGFGAPFDPF